jgi:hypothetical protein
LSQAKGDKEMPERVETLSTEVCKK